MICDYFFLGLLLIPLNWYKKKSKLDANPIVLYNQSSCVYIYILAHMICSTNFCIYILHAHKHVHFSVMIGTKEKVTHGGQLVSSPNIQTLRV